MLTRKRKQSKTSQADATDKLPRRQGRPMKRVSELTPSRHKRIQHSKLFQQQNVSEMASSSQFHLSTLESLPVELIQHIFFLAFEVNMPRASRYLAQVLSKPSIYSALVLFAYFDDDQESPVDTSQFRPAEYRHISLSEQIGLQNGILSCKWCTLDHLKSCMPALSRLQMVQAWHREHKAETKLNIPPGMAVPQVPNELLRPVATLPRLDDAKGMEKHFLAKFEPPSDGELGITTPGNVPGLNESRQGQPLLGPTGDGNYLPRIMQWSSSADETGQLHKTVHQGRSILAVRTIPDRILSGSLWTDEKIALLHLLRQGMRFLTKDRIVQIGVRPLFEGMGDAIRESNEKALLALLELHYALFKVRYLDHPQAFGIAMQKGRLVGPFSHDLPLELFHLACSQPSPSAGRMLSLLLSEGLDSIPSDDEVLTRWATYTLKHASSSEETDLAKWLLSHMEGTNDYGLRRGDPLFVNGMLSWRRREGDYPFSETTFTGAIGYLYEGGSTEIRRAWDPVGNLFH